MSDEGVIGTAETGFARWSFADGVGRVVIDRQDKANCLGPELILALREAVGHLSDNPDLRVMVITGAGGRSFAAGADLRVLVGLNPDSARAFITGLHRLMADVRAVPVPVIAEVGGACLAAAMELAAACDIRVASNTASFGMPEVRVGIPSVIEAALLPRLIGWGRTNRLLLTGETIDAATAEAWGFVDALGTSASDAAEPILTGILASAPKAVRDQKALIQAWEDVSLPEAVQAGIDAFSDAYKTDEPQRWASAALSKSAKR